MGYFRALLPCLFTRVLTRPTRWQVGTILERRGSSLYCTYYCVCNSLDRAWPGYGSSAGSALIGIRIINCLKGKPGQRRELQSPVHERNRNEDHNWSVCVSTCQNRQVQSRFIFAAVLMHLCGACSIKWKQQSTSPFSEYIQHIAPRVNTQSLAWHSLSHETVAFVSKFELVCTAFSGYHRGSFTPAPMQKVHQLI